MFEFSPFFGFFAHVIHAAFHFVQHFHGTVHALQSTTAILD